MRILMFVHHPDVMYYMYTAFSQLDQEVFLATENLTRSIGFAYSSVKQNKLEVVDQLFEPQKLYPNIGTIDFMDNLADINTVDMLWSMLPEIKSIHYIKPTWFDAQMQNYLRNPQFRSMPGIKTANHPKAKAINNFDFIPNWVPYQPPHIERKYITQLITQSHLVEETKELIKLKNEGYPVKIHGGPACPDGFIRDIDILPYTTLLIHNKQFGINCYAVCKALDMGIPVYMGRDTKEKIGFGDLPDSLFLFKEEYSILEAYHKSLSIDCKSIQDTYRSIYTIERTKTEVAKLL
jgi:hypothetical protein